MKHLRWLYAQTFYTFRTQTFFTFRATYVYDDYDAKGYLSVYM